MSWLEIQFGQLIFDSKENENMIKLLVLKRRICVKYISCGGMDVKEYTIGNIINSFSVRPYGSMSLLLGAGASISSGIMSGGQMIWDFKRRIYCSENKIPEIFFPDLSKESVQNEIQTYLDATGEHPTLYSVDEYSHYFEYVFGNRRDRDLYIQNKVKNIVPALGYLCLGALMIEGKINLVNTTNFDDLVKAGIYSIEPGYSIKTMSSAIEGSVGFNLNDGFPTVIKLHGDYLVDNLKNTSQELQELEKSIAIKLQEGLMDKGLIVVGYAGNDNSVMTELEKEISRGGLRYGVIWCKPKNTKLSEQAKKFMEIACLKNELSGIVDIDSFDDLLYRMYLTLNKSYKEIDDRWKDSDCFKPILFGGLKRRLVFTKTNTFEAQNVPNSSFTFETTITTWKELRGYLQRTNDVVAGLFKGKVWAFGEKNRIREIFEGAITSEIDLEKFPEYWHQKEYSFVWSMYYDLIRIALIDKGLICFGKNKYYDKKHSVLDKGNKVYEAIEVFLSCINKKILLTILPTFYIESNNGKPIEKFQKQNIINYHISRIYNAGVSTKINDWIKRLSTMSDIVFSAGDFVLKFNRIVYTSGGSKRNEKWPQLMCFQCEEPKMCFSIEDDNKVSVNQLKGLLNYGPIERLKNGSDKGSIKLALLTPRQFRNEVIQHLEKLKKRCITDLKQEKYFLPEYPGFESVFRRSVDIPDFSDNVRYMEYNADSVIKLTAEKFYKGLTKYIDVFGKNLIEFDVLIIYIPMEFAHLREVKNDSVYFDLHDSIKLYCAGKGIVVQLVEGKSAIPNVKNDLAKIMWGLSTGIYSKAVGRLWKPAIYNKNTAFVGLSYVQSVNNGEKISIGCSQLFDAEGNGMRLYLRPLKDPQIIQKNPYMRSEDASKLMLNLKKLYDDSVPTYDLKRVVIHKTTFFTKEEIEGITRGLSGIEDIELLQIQEFSPWRAIRFDSSDMKNVSLFPIQRGTVIQLDKDTFLIWTHGAVQNEELAGENKNYYKGGRGIPAPLMVRRFLGKSDGATIVNEIMMLTKMNWNSGDSFYKILPVTLDFAKMLSRVAKQDVVMYDRPYDFRFFM
ncbi:MAG: SIR2 family protein [Monoglobales bacterium]